MKKTRLRVLRLQLTGRRIDKEKRTKMKVVTPQEMAQMDQKTIAQSAAYDDDIVLTHVPVCFFG